MTIEKIIVVAKTDKGEVKQIKLTQEQLNQIWKIAVTTSVVLSKQELSSVIDF